MKKISLLLRSVQTSRANNSRILIIKSAKFSGYCFYMNTNMGRFLNLYQGTFNAFQLLTVFGKAQRGKWLPPNSKSMLTVVIYFVGFLNFGYILVRQDYFFQKMMTFPIFSKPRNIDFFFKSYFPYVFFFSQI